jgi:hydroxymethylglutaryl-CoA lyase
VLSIDQRVDLIRRLEAAGATRIETVSFANPDRVPQMAGAEEICAALGDRTFSAIGLVLNERGLERALDCDLDEINLVAYASDGYAGKNTGASATERNLEVARLAERSHAAGRRTSVTISVAFGDPVEGEIPPPRVADIASAMATAGADEIALGDTIGVANPRSVRVVVDAVSEGAPDLPIRCHFHNTRNVGYANAVAAIDAGIEILDAAVGGYGGSPFSPGAGGNVASEDLAHLLDRMGIDTGLDASMLAATGLWLAAELGYDAPPAMLGRVPEWPLR